MGIWLNNQEPGGQALLAVEVERANGTKADVTADIFHPGADVTLNMAGRQSELSTTEAGSLSLVVMNDSGDYTPGLTAAPSSFTLGMPVRWRETVGRKTFDLFTGAMNQPEASFEVLPAEVGDRVAVTAIDWMGQQQQGRTFISNLGEWVMYHGDPALAEYWPCVETSKPFLPVVNPATSPPVAYDLFSSSLQPVFGETEITASSTAMPLGEDVRIPTVGGPLDSAGTPAHTYHMGVRYPTSTGPTIGLGEVFTVVVWRAPTLFAGAIQELFHVELLESPSGDTVALQVLKSASGVLTLESPIGSLTGTITAGGLKPDTFPMAVRFGFSPAVFEVWIGRTRYVGSLSGSGPTGGRFNSADSGAFATQGGFGHLQLYTGRPEDWTFEDYLAQVDHVSNGLTGGLRRQRTDERLHTIALYAGLSESQLRYDRGVAYMPRASLAGSTWQQQAERAVSTEQGRLYTAGDGSQRFHNRQTARYNL